MDLAIPSFLFLLFSNDSGAGLCWGIIIINWLLWSFVIASIGKNREIGFSASFLLCLFVSPIIGLIITLISKRKSDIEFQEKMLKMKEEELELRRKELEKGNQV